MATDTKISAITVCLSTLSLNNIQAKKVTTNNSKAEAKVFNIEFRLFRKNEATKPEKALFRINTITMGDVNRLINMVDKSVSSTFSLGLELGITLKTIRLQIIESKYMNIFCNIISASLAVDESFNKNSL